MRYELSSFDGKRWELEAVYDDQTLAVADARSMMARIRPPEAVRVMENDQEGKSRRVFQRKKNEPETLFEVQRRKEREAELKAMQAEGKARRRRFAEWESERVRQRRLRVIVVSSMSATAAGLGVAGFLLLS